MTKPDPYGEWIIRKIQDEGSDRSIPVSPALITAAQNAWPRVVAHAARELKNQNSSRESEALAADIWESVLRSVCKVLERTDQSASPIEDLESYLVSAFHHRLHRFLKAEQKRRELFEPTSDADLELIESALDTDWISKLENAITVKQIVSRMDAWTRKVWQARQYGYSWKEISAWTGLTEPVAKKRFEYGLEKTRRQIVRLLKKPKPKSTGQGELDV